MPPTTHARLSASASHRWLACPGSIRLCAGLKSPPSKYAEEGTAAHHCAEQALRQNRPVKDLIGKTMLRSAIDGTWYVVTEEMAQAVQVYIDHIRAEQKRLTDAELVIEKRFDLSWLYPNMGGTNDASLVQQYGELAVFDYKHGAGVPVDPERNSQLMYYALGALGKENLAMVETVSITVVQPRAMGDAVKTWRTTPEELYDWAERVLLPGAKATEAEDAPLAEGEHCRFCPALATCPQVRAKNLAAANVFKDLPLKQDVVLPPATTLTTPQLEDVYEVAELISQWVDAVKAELHQRLYVGGEAGVKYKVVEGRSSREWQDEVVAMDKLKAAGIDVWVSKVVSPAQAEERLKDSGYKPAERKGIVDALVNVSHGTQLVPLAHKKPALKGGAPALPFDAIVGEIKE